MATTKSAMTPEQAAATIADVQDYRQGFTARAAGTIWMVWGLVLGALAIGDVANWAGDGGQEGNLTDGLYVGYVLFVLAGGILVNHAVWKSQALVTGEGSRFWLVSGLAVLLIGTGAVLANLGLTQLFEATLPDEEGTFYRSGFGIMATTVAATITFLQRKRVTWIPGALAAAAFLLFQSIFPLLIGSSEAMSTMVRASFLSGIVAVAVCAAVGLYLFRRG